MVGRELRWVRVLENLAVELRGSGKTGWEGSIAYRGFHGSHKEAEKGCGFAGSRGGKRELELDWRGFGG